MPTFCASVSFELSWTILSQFWSSWDTWGNCRQFGILWAAWVIISCFAHLGISRALCAQTAHNVRNPAVTAQSCPKLALRNCNFFGTQNKNVFICIKIWHISMLKCIASHHILVKGGGSWSWETGISIPFNIMRSITNEYIEMQHIWIHCTALNLLHYITLNWVHSTILLWIEHIALQCSTLSVLHYIAVHYVHCTTF